MKQIAVMFALLLSALCMLPLAGQRLAQAAQGGPPAASAFSSPSPFSAPAATPEPTVPPTALPTAQPTGALAPFYILNESSGQIMTVPVRDYLIGAVASEMPMTWPDAALQAQAIACHSYALYCKENNPPGAYSGAYFSADPARRQNFMTDEVLRSYWGTAYAENYARLSALVDEVLSLVVQYEGKPAGTSYFASCCGHTEASQNVWETALPYLQGVESPWDKQAEDYARTLSFSAQQMYDQLVLQLGLQPGSIRPENYFGASTYTNAGYIKTIEVCGSTIKGTALRKALSLRSSCFSIAYEDGSFLVTTYGYGHGVGFSQQGARFMAEEGRTYAEILSHYFPGTVLGAAEA